jgi:hypothetical protein
MGMPKKLVFLVSSAETIERRISVETRQGILMAQHKDGFSSRGKR